MIWVRLWHENFKLLSRGSGVQPALRTMVPGGEAQPNVLLVEHSAGLPWLSSIVDAQIL